MHADLERLIALQRVDSAKERLASNQNARRAMEKELAVHQGRLSKFREQAMAVKTNQEYHAIQHEIAHAQTQIKTHEDQMLEGMLEADELTAAVKSAETDATAEQKTVDADRKAMKAEHVELQKSLERMRDERAAIIGALDKQLLQTFELVAKKRHGVAVAEAKNGICTICHVRLRPQVFNTVRRNEEIVQCDSCQRILYFAAPAGAAAASSDASPRAAS